MNIHEHLLPGKENALTPEYLATKYHFSSVRMLQKQIEAERKAGKVILSSTTPPGGYYLPAAGDTMEIRKFTILDSGEMFAEQIIAVIGGIIEKELNAREKAQQERMKKYTEKYTG